MAKQGREEQIPALSDEDLLWADDLFWADDALYAESDQWEERVRSLPETYVDEQIPAAKAANKMDSAPSTLKSSLDSDWLRQLTMEIESRTNPAAEQKAYADAPILYKASQLKRPVLPERYTQMKRIAFSRDALFRSEPWIFCKQGAFMASFTDDCPYDGSFTCYYPTYRAMNDAQLRGYFTWRTRLREGRMEPTDPSFVFVYLYELINQIGISSAGEGFEKLCAFRAQYPANEKRVFYYLNRWLCDYAVYYGLDAALLKPYIEEELQIDNAVQVLADYQSADDTALFAALAALSSYDPARSRLYKTHPAAFTGAVTAAFRAVCAYYEKHRKKSYCEKLFGKIEEIPYVMFAEAIFYQPQKHPDADYVISDCLQYRCRDNRWYCRKRLGGKGKNRELGKLLRAADAVIRRQLAYDHPLKGEELPKYLLAEIEKAVGAFFAQKQQQTARRVSFDLSKLQSIRADAEETREQLLTEVDEEAPIGIEAQEREAEPAAASAMITEPPPAAPDTPPDEELPLDENETAFLRILLYGGDLQALLRERGLLLSMVADSINEKLFDRFSDTVLLFDGETPEPVEDYLEQLKGWIQP